jgi:7-cyano-7-deazaguanine synthase
MMKRRDLAVVLVSGGMDSCVTAALAGRKYRLAFLHLNYGQRTERRELKAFHAIADHYCVRRRLVVDVDYLVRIGGSSLTDRSMKIPVRKGERRTPGRNQRDGELPSTYVPFRNANILSIAVSWAEVLGAKAIFIGAVEEDSSGYPDCRREFYDAFNRVISAGTKPGSGIRIVTPVIGMRKSGIVRTGLRLRAPLHLSWSCYQREDRACGVCDSCVLRLKGFRSAGTEDPLPYVVRPEIR